ncbi:MAG TPA: prepilin-type N-terminal cleavage/methylation domain-containing protein [bacterium]|nr:prepilin-type N-terminal cleavage/methylation domain-containing protein [Candidatus Omnitrophota bacterium]HOJ59436.1 prepilin-type N-terminal cleavage/methylation domain-containing protein [bacterium]HPP01667.1 prepilin-type N-terminal cleavage/methylation domain-containing protein [bacterium]
MTKATRDNGFTLIELLIVVAIIGILAAIAVPNFLNAQIRAKIARCEADARSIGTALESYRLDTNEYPPDGRSGVYTHFSLKWANQPSAGKHLTTPVAYMSSIPWDAFNSKMGWVGWTPIDNAEMDMKAMFFLNRKYNEGVNSWEPGLPFENRFRAAHWHIYSIGPSVEYGWRAELTACWLMPYDPSNGLTSKGGIWRIG